MTSLSYALENIAAMWVSQFTEIEIYKCLVGMPFELYNCSDAIDVVMGSHFVLILDGSMLLRDDPDIESLECYLSNFSGEMIKCKRCRNNCLKAELISETENISFGPDYKVPIIFLNPDKRQRDVEGLMAIVPPVTMTEPFSLELKQWLNETILSFHKKALIWREENNKWTNIEILKDSRKQITALEIAQERWRPKEININMKFPDFE